MNKLYIVRHGKTKWNNEGRMQGRLDAPLIEEGIDYAKKLGTRLKDVNFSIAYSSPSPRAKHTMDLILKDREVDIEFNPNLHEMSFGIWEGQSKTEIQKSYKTEYKHFRKNPPLFQVSDGERYEDVEHRAVQFLNMINHKHQNENILIVSHCILIKSLITHMKNEKISETFWDHNNVQNCSLTVVTFNNGEFNFECIGDTGHYHI